MLRADLAPIERCFAWKLPRDLDEALERLARQRGTTRSAVIREALAVYARRPKDTVSDVAGDLIGSFPGGPRDLSVNPEHLKGFGDTDSRRRRSTRRTP